MIDAKIEAEKAVLGSILFDDSIISQLKLLPEHFHEGFNRSCYAAMQELNRSGESIDVVTLFSKMNDPAGLITLTELSASVPSARNVYHYEKIVLEKHQEEMILNLSMKYANTADIDDYIKLVDSAKLVQNFALSEQRTVKDDMLDIYESLYEETSNNIGIAASFGFKDLDKLVGGIKGGDLMVVGARPSMGKTAFALNVALNASEKGVIVDVFSIEMTRKSLLKRLISMTAWLNSQCWHNPYKYFSDNDKKKVMDSIAYIDNLPLFINEQNPLTTEDIEKQIISTKSKFNDDKKHIVVIDYLQLMRTSKAYQNKVIEIGEITRELKSISKRHNVGIILLSQLSRGVEQRQDKRPMMADLRESGAIEQDADIIAFLYRNDYYDRDESSDGLVEIIIAKNREGAVGDVQLAFIKEYSKFVNLEMRLKEAK